MVSWLVLKEILPKCFEQWQQFYKKYTVSLDDYFKKSIFQLNVEILTCLLKILLYHYFHIVIPELQIYCYNHNKPDGTPNFSFISYVTSMCIKWVGFSTYKAICTL